MDIDTCGVWGGDGRISNSFGLTDRGPSCHGTGRRSNETLTRNVTKTKPSHHKAPGKAIAVKKKTWQPESYEGVQLATEVRDSPSLAQELRERLTRDIIDYEESHGTCTETFQKKVRKQLRKQLRPA